jgi:hypothetical protein
MVQVVEQEVKDAYLELREMAGRTAESAAAMTSADDTKTALQEQFNVGGIASSAIPKYYEDLLTTRLLLATANVRYLQALYGYNVALAKLKLAVAADPLENLTGGVTNEVTVGPDAAGSLGDHAFGEFIR